MRRKKTDRQKIEKELDDISKLLAKHRDNWTCQHCGRGGDKRQMHGSHVIPVSSGKRLRWDLSNIKCLCAYCHRRWWHGNPLEAWEWFQGKFPARADYLVSARMLGAKKWSVEELEIMLDNYRERLSEYERA